MPYHLTFLAQTSNSSHAFFSEKQIAHCSFEQDAHGLWLFFFPNPSLFFFMLFTTFLVRIQKIAGIDSKSGISLRGLREIAE